MGACFSASRSFAAKVLLFSYENPSEPSGPRWGFVAIFSFPRGTWFAGFNASDLVCAEEKGLSVPHVRLLHGGSFPPEARKLVWDSNSCRLYLPKNIFLFTQERGQSFFSSNCMTASSSSTGIPCSASPLSCNARLISAMFFSNNRMIAF